MRKLSLFGRRTGENLRVSASVVSLVMALSRSVLSSATCTALCAGVGVTWTGLAFGQDENATVAQQPAANQNAISFQMKPITADVFNTDAQRLNADADQDNWRLHGRTYDNQRFSPLTEISRDNVKRLAITAIIHTGIINSHEATPLVVDGILYISTPSDHVQAYDAVT